MKKSELIKTIAESIAKMEGYYLTPRLCRRTGRKWPPKARRLGNPGMIRQWKDKNGVPYPTVDGFVDFIEWAKRQEHIPCLDPYSAGHEEGFRVLNVLVGQYIDGKYHGGKSPTLYEFFEKYAPATDSNNPKNYAEFVAKRVGIKPDIPLSEAITDDQQTV